MRSSISITVGSRSFPVINTPFEVLTSSISSDLSEITWISIGNFLKDTSKSRSKICDGEITKHQRIFKVVLQRMVETGKQYLSNTLDRVKWSLTKSKTCLASSGCMKFLNKVILGSHESISVVIVTPLLLGLPSDGTISLLGLCCRSRSFLWVASNVACAL